MLNDPGQSEEFRESQYWESSLLDFKAIVTLPDGRQRSNSLSGGERNRLVMRSGDKFIDRSLVSGVDCREDARSFSLLDYDNDGWVDIALASVNDKRLRLFRNRFGDLGAKGRVVEITLRGANSEAAVSSRSNRDAVGAFLTVETSQGKRAYRKSIGEGMAAQNSGRIRVTLAEGEQLKNLSVRWPSGKVTKLDSIAEKARIEMIESSDQ
ncbi:MAG: ASPIC/UnbV domain-containing protein [Akkermansiaceae bacterium]